MTKMSYEKCYGCPHHDIVYKMVGPFEIICKITGERLIISECPIMFCDESDEKIDIGYNYSSSSLCPDILRVKE